MATNERARERSPIDRKRRTGGGGGGGGGSKPHGRRAPPERRIFVSNIPFDMKWQELKDLFRQHVGEVTYVELFNDENEKPRGCGILELASKELANTAVEKMHRFDLKGRKLVVKEDFDVERDKHGKIIKGSSGGGAGAGGGRSGERERDARERLNERSSSHQQQSHQQPYGNTYGLSNQFLESLGIVEPLHTRIFVANLVYTVDEKKLREVFRLAGRVVTIELSRDKEGKSRGHAVIEFDHPVEAVQAISMFNNQMLYDRKMTVRLDKQPGMSPEELEQLPSRLPEGLASVGMGLGSNGNPLTAVAKTLAAQSASGGGGGIANLAGVGLNQPAGGLLSAVAPSSAAGNPLNEAVALLARQMGLNSATSNQNTAAAVSTLATAIASNLASSLPLGGGMNNMGGMNMGSSGLAGMGSGAGGLSGSMGSGGLNQPSGMGAGLVGNAGAGMNMPSAMSDMGGRGGNASYNPSSMPPMSGRADPSMSGPMPPRGMMGNMGAVSAVRPSDTIVVRNLPSDCTWQDLRELFSQCGDVKYAEMKERGTGLVRFDSERDADRAVSIMHNTTKGGRLIDVRLY